VIILANLKSKSDKMKLDNLSSSIYVINLKHRKDRKTHITSELKKIRCKTYKLIEGINGNDLINTTKLSNGMLGLNQTYLKIYDEWSREKNDSILIIEDDCIFLENFNSELNLYMSNIPDNWEMVYFGGNHNYHMGSGTEKINPYCIKLNHTFTAHCVLLKNYVFEELIQNIKYMTIENDVMMANLQKKYNSYSSAKALTSQLIGFSNIENKFVNYNGLIN
jgi:GR25 family glycosyltransferase involved in LPS biosynthesis